MAACAVFSASTTCSSETSLELALLALLERRVDDVLAVDQADAHARDCLREGNPGQGQCGRSPCDRQHVGVILGVGGEHQGNDLRLVPPARGKQRTDGAVDDPAGEHFFLGRLAFALEEAAGNAARRVGVFAIVDRQRQEVDAFARTRRATGRHEHDRIAVTDDDGAVGLLGQLAGLYAQGFV